MHKTIYLLLLCVIVMFGVATAYAAQTSVIDPAVARIAYLEDKVANLESAVQNGCMDSCMDDCMSCCGPRLCGNPGLIGGYDFLWLSPHFSNGVAYQVVDSVAPVSVWTAHGYPTDYNMAPRFWLGYQGYNGLGVRVRYQQFDQPILSQILTTDATRTVFFDGVSATGGETLAIQAGMELHVLDVDFTKDFNVCCAQVTVGAGLRYGKLLFDYGALRTDSVSPLATIGQNTFEGIGPSAFIDFKAPIRQSRLSVIGDLRGSVLFGRRRIERLTVGTDPISVDASIARINSSTGVIDAALGLQYDRCLTRGVDGFIRVAWEGQLWMDVGSPTYSGGDMAMQGLCIGVGFNR